MTQVDASPFMLWLGQATFSSPELATEEAYAPSNPHDNRRRLKKTDNASDRELDVADNLATQLKTTNVKQFAGETKTYKCPHLHDNMGREQYLRQPVRSGSCANAPQTAT